MAKLKRAWSLALGAALVFVLAFAAYWPVLRGGFIWDDFLLVQQNPLVTGKLGLGTIWFRTDFPLSNILFWGEWRHWGDHPAGYHLVNVLLHAANGVLLWRVLERLKIPAGWLAAALFVVHPVCVASAAWVSEQKNTLSLCFYLLSLLAYLSHETARGQGRTGQGAGWYVLSLGAFVLALFSKTTTVMLPVVLLACAWGQRGRLKLGDVLRTTPFFALALGFGLMSVWFQVSGAMAGATVQTESWWGRLAGAGMALWFYLGKALLPSNLCMIYPRWQIAAAAPVSYLPLPLWCALLGWSWWYRRGWGRHALFALGCFTFTLFPVLGFFDFFYLALSRVSDHLAYLPLTALLPLLAAGLWRGLSGKALWYVGGVLVAGLCVLSAQRAAVFATEEVLWTDTLARNPNAWCAHANLGWMLAAQQKYDEARGHLEASLALKPDNAQAHSNLGRVLSLQGKAEEAEAHFQAALRIKPNDADIRKTYASALAEQGKRAEAANQLREALRLRPETEARVELATLLHQGGRLGEAAAEYRQVLAVKPDQPEALNNLAWLLATGSDATMRDGAEAVKLAERVCRLSGYKDAQALGTLAAAYAEAGRFSEAVSAAQQAIELAKAGGDSRLAAVSRQLLVRFAAGKAYHEAPAVAPRPGAD